jgi:L-fucose mutarotase/ribose pyranase (RbsD/FucU family)
MILWPNNEENLRFIQQSYAQIRDNPKAFDEKARSQPSMTLARKEGRLEKPIGHHTTGNEELERAAFSLKEGEVSSVIGTPEGLVVLKCDRRFPAEQVDRDVARAELMPEIIEKKTQAIMPVYFLELQKQVHPRLLLEDTTRAPDIKDEVKRDLGTQAPSR